MSKIDKIQFWLTDGNQDLVDRVNDGFLESLDEPLTDGEGNPKQNVCPRDGIRQPFEAVQEADAK